jgi:hypothetical protein
MTNWIKTVDIHSILSSEGLTDRGMAVKIQELLKTVPEFVEDESILQEMEDCFEMYPDEQSWVELMGNDDFNLILDSVYEFCDNLKIWCGDPA